MIKNIGMHEQNYRELQNNKSNEPLENLQDNDFRSLIENGNKQNPRTLHEKHKQESTPLDTGVSKETLNLNTSEVSEYSDSLSSESLLQNQSLKDKLPIKALEETQTSHVDGSKTQTNIVNSYAENQPLPSEIEHVIKASDSFNTLSESVALGSNVLSTISPSSNTTGLGSEVFDSKWFAQGKLSYIAKSAQLYTNSEMRLGSQAINNATASTQKQFTSSSEISSQRMYATYNYATRDASIKSHMKASNSSSNGNLSAVISSKLDYLKKKLTAVEKQGEVSIFIRDYKLTSEEKSKLVESVQNLLGEQGKEVKSITVNGEAVYVKQKKEAK